MRRRRAGNGLVVDKRNLKNGAETRIKKVALKYCGGCNPGFDRVAYVEKIKSAAGPDIEWVTLDDEEIRCRIAGGWLRDGLPAAEP